MRLGEGALRGPGPPTVPTWLRLVVTDVSEHPDSSIGDIAARTGLPQSHVSQSVARLRARCALQTASDPGDGRRTLVRLSPEVQGRAAQLGSVSVDAALGAALGITDPDAVAALVRTLESVLARLREPPASTRPADGQHDDTLPGWPFADDQ